MENVNGKWFVLDKEDVAYFYKGNEKGKMELKADWCSGSLGLVDYNVRLKKAKNVDSDPQVLPLIKLYNDVMNKKVEELKPVSSKMEEVLNQLNPDGKAFWAMEGSLEEPIPYEEPYGVAYWN